MPKHANTAVVTFACFAYVAEDRFRGKPVDAGLAGFLNAGAPRQNSYEELCRGRPPAVHALRDTDEELLSDRLMVSRHERSSRRPTIDLQAASDVNVRVLDGNGD